MNDPFASFDPLGKQKQAATAHSYATMPTPMPLAAPAAGPFNQFGGMPPQAPYGHHPHHQGMQQSNPFGMGMPMGGPPLQTMAAQQPPKMFPNNSGAAFMTQPGGPAFGGLGMMPQQQQQYVTNPFGAAPPPPPQQQVQGNTNPFGAEPVVYDSIKNLLHPKPADPFATAPSGPMARPAPLKTQTSTIADFDPFSPRADTPRMPQTVANGYDTSTADRTGSGGASALADRQNRARQTQDAARTELGFDTNAFQHANATPKVSLKHMAPSSEPNRTASIRTAAPPYDDSPFFSDSNDAFAGQTVSNLDDDFAPSGDNRTNSWGHEARGSSNGSEDAVAETCGPNEYEVTFESGRKLGVLMERVDVWSGKRDDRRFEVAVVKLVVENGAADRVGVTIGSSVLAINNRSVAKDSYMVVLDLIKTAPRPMTIRFQRGAVNKDTTQGNVLSRISNGTFSVGNLTSGNASWTPKYFAYGGAKLDVLQLFVSRAAYHECVISLYEKRVVHTQIQSFRLCRDHKISPIKSKIYKGYGNLHYFSLTVPSLRFVAAKFASEDYETIKNMWSLAYEAIERKKRMGY